MLCNSLDIKNPPNCIISDSCVFEDFIYYASVLRIFETCVLVNNSLWEKLDSSLSSPTAFDERFKVNWVPFLIPDFNLLSYE